MFPDSPTEVSRRQTKYDHETYSYSLSGGFARGLTDTAPASVPPVTTQRELSAISLSKRTLLVTDAASDLPADWRAKAGVLLLPVKLRNGEISRIDEGDEVASIRFAVKDLPQFDGATHTLASSVDATGELTGQHTNDDTDFVLQIAMSSMRSNGYANSLTAAQKLMVQGARDRRRAGNMRPFKMWVVDSAASFNGHGLLIAECARLLGENVAVPEIVQHVDALRRQVKTHVISTQSGFAAAAKEAFDQATRCVNAGLDAPFVCASYAGRIADLRHIDAFVELSATCAKHGVTLLTSTMSMTNAASLGAGSVLISSATSVDI